MRPWPGILDEGGLLHRLTNLACDVSVWLFFWGSVVAMCVGLPILWVVDRFLWLSCFVLDWLFGRGER